MIDDQQIAVANLVGTILRLALAVTIAGMTSDARVAHPSRSQALTGFLFEGVEFLEEALTRIEVFLHASLYCGRCNSRIAGLLSGSQLSTRIPLVSSKIASSLAKRLVVGCQRTQFLSCVATVRTC